MRHRRPSRPVSFFWLASILLASLIVIAAGLNRPHLSAILFDLTGEEQFLAQIKGLSDLAADLLRPRLRLAPAAALEHVDVNPYGVNVFLNEEVELAKRELTVRLAA